MGVDSVYKLYLLLGNLKGFYKCCISSTKKCDRVCHFGAKLHIRYSIQNKYRQQSKH